MKLEMNLTLVNPANNQELIAQMRTQLLEAQRTVVERIEAATADLNTENYAAHRLNAFKEEVGYFSDGGKAFAKTVMASCGADAVMAQIAASEAAVKAANKAYESRLRELKAANEPQAERFEYIAEFCMTEAAWTALTKKLMKDGVEFRARRVKDNESAKIGKLFD